MVALDKRFTRGGPAKRPATKPIGSISAIQTPSSSGQATMRWRSVRWPRGGGKPTRGSAPELEALVDKVAATMVVMKRSMSAEFTPRLVEPYIERFSGGFDSIDFSRYSKARIRSLGATSSVSGNCGGQPLNASASRARKSPPHALALRGGRAACRRRSSATARSGAIEGRPVAAQALANSSSSAPRTSITMLRIKRPGASPGCRFPRSLLAKTRRESAGVEVERVRMAPVLDERCWRSCSRYAYLPCAMSAN